MWKHPLFEALATFGQAPLMTRTARRRPLSHHYRNPKDPHQAARIEAAKRKRVRKAAKLHNQTLLAEHFQKAHRSPGVVDGMPAYITPASLSPMYIAK